MPSLDAEPAMLPPPDAPRNRKSDSGTSSSSQIAEVVPLPKRQRSQSPVFSGQAAGAGVDWDAHLSAEGHAREPPTLRQIATRFAGIPGVIGLHGGFPAGEAFPITSLSYTLRDGSSVTIDDPAKMYAMQQYSINPLGYGPLQEWAAAHTAALHAPPCETATAINIGSNCTLEMLCSLLLEAGDGVLCEQFTYSHMVESTINMRGYRALPLEMDAAGILPKSLRSVLAAETAAASAAGRRPPRVLYTVPTGQNPTGSTVPAARKAEIYAVCRQYDVIILEDDPYYYLQFPADPASGQQRGLHSLERSYLSLDTDGRVIRLDSFAKFLAPGLRLGWATGAPRIIQKLTSCIHGTALGPCATTQVMVAEMLRAWGDAGLAGHVERMQGAYAQRAGVVLAAAEKHLTGLASWRAPQAGMFLWLALGAGVEDADQILDLMADAKVVVVPGRICHALGPRPPVPCPFVRISFAAAPHAELEEAMARLATVLRTFAAGQTPDAAPPPAAAAAAAAAGEPAPPAAAAAAQ